MKTIVLLFSGGIDSFVSYYLLKQEFRNSEVVPVYIDYGGKYCEKEIAVVEELLPQTKIIDGVFNFADIEYGEKAFIPNRNLHLLALATAYGDTVFMGGLADDNVGDKTPKFCKFASAALSQSLERPIVVTSPLWDMHKIDVIEEYIKMVGKTKATEDLIRTTSCYHPTEHYCGECPACFRKMCALDWNEIYLPFFNMELAKQYYETRMNYSNRRAASIRRAYQRIYVEE